eukprot:12926459-Prorocentrum_lima.AAC.1
MGRWTCQLAPGVDILVDVHICGSGGMVKFDWFISGTLQLAITGITFSSLCDGEGVPGYILFQGLGV